jgi:hypothetical protein
MSKATRSQRGGDDSPRDEAHRESLRSDLNRRARHALAPHNQLRASAEGLSFELKDEVLVIRGSVPSFYLKQMVQTVLKDLDGVRQIDNQVEVVGANGFGRDGHPPDARRRWHL